ncbi:hypothetical protein BC477_05675 [Clavibacter michiganensis subsp. michiganensis]|uniref:Uncharacterized protein n=1 Tax=Clavibacter michiganensis subsp. michiganensis TaxID=33013 RepID=A0A251XLA8_CLAMM|nr:hypothetical protein BC477_05675 [Clavibacter michiganensis subsp. michiganensis]OUE04206.1 hypothetical protein CMMCAS07_04605 [Clavibacter michiganensis subsp. michiganensis]
MTHHDSTDPTDHDHATGAEHDDVLYKTQGNPVPDAHDEERREAPPAATTPPASPRRRRRRARATPDPHPAHRAHEGRRDAFAVALARPLVLRPGP